MTVTPRTTI